MRKTVEEIVKTLSRSVEAERKYASELRELARSITYVVPLSAVIEALATDSEKHAQLYEALIKIATGSPQPRLIEEDLKLIQNVIDRHIETEMKMIEETKKLLSSIEDSKMKLLIAAIYYDEIKHHKVLTDVKDKLSKIRALTEEQFWEAVWRDSPWHGAPGG